jgi:hypothetical protein
MVNKEDIKTLINPRLNRVLTAVELSVPKDKYGTCRKVILNEFGNSGLVRDLEELFGGSGDKDGQGSGGPILRRKAGAL